MSPPATQPRSFRFRPRFKLLAYVAILVGGALLISAFVLSLTGASRLFALGGGIAGLALGGLYLVSPTWAIEVLVSDEGIEVLSKGDRRFFLPWDDVVKVVSSPSTDTCFVDGGDPERSLLVPGPGASAPYEIEDRAGLCREILARAPSSLVIEVESLESYKGEKA